MSPQSPLFVPARKVVTNLRAIAPSGKVFANSGECEHTGNLRTKEETVMAANWNELMEEHEIAYLRADICLGSPQSYSLEDKKNICADMESTTAEIDAAMRDDFQQMPPLAQAKMLDLLQKADPEHFDWWLEVLAGKTGAFPQEKLFWDPIRRITF